MTALITSNEHLVISGDKVPVAAYQAIYHKITSRVEKLAQTFPDAYIITADDIIHLDRLLNQSIIQYPVKSSSSNCGISLHKNERIEPSSFEKFRIFNFSMNHPTSKISYQLDFMTVLPVEIVNANDIVQRFKVSVIIDQDFVEEEDNLPTFMKGMLSGNNISLVVEYSDYNVGRNLQVTVQDWVSSLQGQPNPSWIRHLEQKSDFVSTIVPRLGLAAGLFGLSKWWHPVDTASVVRDLFLGLGWSVVIYIAFHIIVVEMYRQLSQARPLTFICLTKGDIDRRTTMALRRKRKAAITLGLLTLIIVTIPINVFSNAVYEYLN